MKTKHLLMACTLTAAVTSPSDASGIWTRVKNFFTGVQEQGKKATQWAKTNPNTASALAGGVAGTAGGAGATYAIMKPEQGSTVTVTKHY